jgi:alpha-N-arabinofuranosidase
VKKATIRVDSRREIGRVDPRVFGGFVEHLGRAIYGGLYDPGSAHADPNGWRRDVLEALRRLDFTILRYPGGNFVSGYHWRDGVGPREERKTVIDKAWNSLEPNLVGTDEFLQLSHEMGWQPMLTANLGTGDANEAADWVLHCAEQDHPVKIWCLGNEMDGEWQIGHVPADKYVGRARAAASAMRGVDPELELVACGSSNPEMPTWLEWDRTVLEGLHGVADYISLHRYATNFDGDSEDFLAISNDVDRQIESIDRLCREVADSAGDGKRAYLCFDEWNVWYRTQFKRFSDGHGGFAPRLIEEVYNLEDALVVAGFLNSFVRHADVVRIANLAQIVNAIAPILTLGDQMVKQSIFWPFEMFSRRRSGTALVVNLDSPSYTSRSYGEVSVVDTSAILDGNRLSVFAINRCAEEVELTLQAADRTVESLGSAECVDGPSLESSNSLQNPDTVTSREFSDVTVGRDRTVLALPSHSFVAATFNLS